jgi:hypothetical protein
VCSSLALAGGWSGLAAAKASERDRLGCLEQLVETESDTGVECVKFISGYQPPTSVRQIWLVIRER